MQQIAKNELYELVYDEGKNRIYWTMKGFWRSMSVVPDFDKDWDKIQSHTKDNFTILANLVDLKVLPEEVRMANEERQEKLLRSGCKKVACIILSPITNSSVQRVTEASGMEEIVKNFNSQKEAEDWLNE
ncbi:hypothetical protein KKC94_01240 [Patescibacteria group bacterium]|nr:hypothetical protein [Patescibacteria group bacterium]